MSPIVRLCRCGRIPPPGLRHCPGHTPRGNDTYAYQQASRHIRATATHCWLCHEPFTPDDPATADHIIPRSQGGTDAMDNLRAAHLSCNSRRGATRAPSEISNYDVSPSMPRKFSRVSEAL